MSVKSTAVASTSSSVSKNRIGRFGPGARVPLGSSTMSVRVTPARIWWKSFRLGLLDIDFTGQGVGNRSRTVELL